MFDHASWHHQAADLLGVPPESCDQLPQAIGIQLDCGIIWSATPPQSPDVRLWCGFKKNTLKIGVLIRREQLWPNSSIINGHSGTHNLSLTNTRIGILAEGHLVTLNTPAFMLCNDDVIRIMASWLSGLGVEHADAMTTHATMHMGVSDAVLISRTLSRKAGIFVKDTPVNILVEQAKIERERLIDLAKLALAQPISIPTQVNTLLSWLDWRFFQTSNHPTSHTLVNQAYTAHATSILEGMWHDTKTSKLSISSQGVYNRQPQIHAGIKLTTLQALCQPA